MATFGLSRQWSTSFVGRRQELAWIRGRCELAARGYGHLVLVEGEAGVGKTRLAQSVLEEARRAGALVIRGRCYEHLDLAYLPLRDGLIATLIEAVGGRVDRGADLGLLRRLAGLDDGGAEAESAESVDEKERTRQLLALTRLVLELARERYVVLFLDDIDWADDATIDLLIHLLFRLDDVAASLLLLVTSRADPGTRAAAGLERVRGDPRAATIRLHPLSPLEATELAHEVEPAIGVDRARRLATAAGGNPLLVEALARHDVDGVVSAAGSRHPLVSVIDSRLRSLTVPTHGVVRATAFLVPDCTLELLVEVTELDAPAVRSAVAEAVDAHVLADGNGDGRIAFTHPLYAQTLRAQVGPASKRRLHSRIATILLSRRAAGKSVSVTDIARHLMDAEGEADQALVFDYATRAGDEAMKVTAWGEAARCYEAAIGTAPAELVTGDAVALHRLAALCHRANLDLPRAVARFQSAISLLGPGGDGATLADLHTWQMRCAAGHRDLLDIARDRGPLEHLVDVIEHDHPALAAEGLVELAQSHWMDWEMELAEAAAYRAMSIADPHECHEAYERATTALCPPLWARYELRESLAALEDGVAHARAAHDPSVLSGGAMFRVPLLLTWLGRLDEVRPRALECLNASERAAYPLENPLPLAALTQLAVVRGNYDEAEQHAHQALLIQRLAGYHWGAGLCLPALMTAHVARGRWTAAREALDAWGASADDIAQLTIGILSRYVDACERGHVSPGSPLPRLPRTPSIGVDSWAAAQVEIVRREGDVANIERAYEVLSGIDARGGVVTSGLVMLVPRLLGVAADHLGADEAAVRHLEEAIAVGERLGAAPEVARAQVDLATVWSRRGERSAARDLVDRASETFERLAMVPDLERAEELTGERVSRTTKFGASRVESVVIFFSDIVDSTRHTERLGATRYRGVAKEVESLVRSAIVTQGGSVVTGINLGDGLLGLFPSPARAIAAARLCAEKVPETGLHLHLAVHRGEAIVDGPRIFGSPVNFAARLCDLTGPDEILVSETVRSAVTGLDGISFVDRGEYQMKGIDGPQHVWAVVVSDDAPSPDTNGA
jgi:class 3 adenylate cyclase